MFKTTDDPISSAPFKSPLSTQSQPSENPKPSNSQALPLNPSSQLFLEKNSLTAHNFSDIDWEQENEIDFSNTNWQVQTLETFCSGGCGTGVACHVQGDGSCLLSIIDGGGKDS